MTAALLLIATPTAALPSAAPAVATTASTHHNTLIGYAAGDDWEPSVAADASGSVYVVWAHFGGVPGCGTCGSPAAMLEISRDGGRSFGPPTPLAPSHRQQVDFNVRANASGGVFVSYLDGPDTVVQVSHDRGLHFTTPVAVNRGVHGSTDKPGLVVQGSRVYVAYDIRGVGIVARSTDGGRHFTNSWLGFPWKLTTFSLNGGGAIAPDGTLYYAWIGVDHNRGNLTPQVSYLSRSTDGGATWTFESIATGLPNGPTCPQACGWDFLGPQTTVAVDGMGRVYVALNAGTLNGGAPGVWITRSNDRGATWSPLRSLSTDGTPSWHAFPALDAREDGELFAAWMDNHTGAYNVWFRSSFDGGRHWSTETRISLYRVGSPFVNRSGFEFPYGDYFILRATPGDVVHFAWGEGPNWTGPGNVVYARLPIDD